MASPAITTIPRGASLYRFEVGGQNILLSFPHPSMHETIQHPFFGETIGRVTNRIENATLHNLNGNTYKLATNANGINTLHGGNVGWGKAIWKGPRFIRKGNWDAGITSVHPENWNDPGGAGREGVVYEHLSPDGDEGFPGAVNAAVYYFEGRDAEGKVVLDSEYEVEFAEETPGVEETVVSMTNHSYFNLNPRSSSISPDLSSHSLTLSTAMHQTPSSTNPGIPDGTFTPHPNVPFPNKAFPLYDNETHTAVPIDECFVVSPNLSAGDIPLDTRAKPLHLLAELTSAASNITLRIESTEPAFQCYTGGFVDVPAWPAGSNYEAGPGFAKNAGICIEPSRFVNAAGREDWRRMVLLRRGTTYGARSRYTAWKA